MVGKKFYIFTVAVCLMFVSEVVPSEAGISQDEAFEVAAATAEAKALYAMNDGAYAKCVEVSVVRPCDSGWVTCIDDAWVVKFHIGEQCGVSHDGRLDLIIVVDGKTKNIISRYPEAGYYRQASYCLMDADCLVTEGQCLNFVYGQLAGGKTGENMCQCREYECGKK